MKTSFYNLFFEINKKLILFNSLTGNLIEVEVEMKEALESGNLKEIPFDVSSQLLEMGFLQEEDVDQTSEYLSRYEHSKERDSVLDVKLFMATSCNLGCPYCYQSAPAKPGNVIQKNEVDKLIKWIDWEVSKNGVKGLNLEFYGGEPLLARMQMPRLIGQLNQIFDKYALPVSYSIITNATLIDDSIIDLFIANNVSMQITMDGDEKTHDSRRAWKTTGKGSFQQIFENLEKICNRGGANLIRIRMNVDQRNISEVHSVASRAHGLGITSFTCGRIHFREKETEYTTEMISSKDFDENYDYEIFKILQPFGFADSPSKLDSIDTCLYHWKRGYSVSPSLHLFKCDELIDYPEFCVGQIGEDGIPQMNQLEYDKAVSRKPTDFEHCTSCRYLPQCGSGCSIRALNAKGTPHINFCEATYDSVHRKVAAYVRADSEGLISNDASSKCSNCHCGN